MKDSMRPNGVHCNTASVSKETAEVGGWNWNPCASKAQISCCWSEEETARGFLTVPDPAHFSPKENRKKTHRKQQYTRVWSHWFIEFCISQVIEELASRAYCFSVASIVLIHCGLLKHLLHKTTDRFYTSRLHFVLIHSQFPLQFTQDNLTSALDWSCLLKMPSVLLAANTSNNKCTGTLQRHSMLLIHIPLLHTLSPASSLHAQLIIPWEGSLCKLNQAFIQLKHHQEIKHRVTNQLF